MASRGTDPSSGIAHSSSTVVTMLAFEGAGGTTRMTQASWPRKGPSATAPRGPDVGAGAAVGTGARVGTAVAVTAGGSIAVVVGLADGGLAAADADEGA